MDEQIERLRQHCREKAGVTVRREPKGAFGLLEGSLATFAEFHLDESIPVLMIRCDDKLRRRLAESSTAIQVSDRMRWKTKGWKWTDVILDGSIPEQTLRELIDHSYRLLYDGFDDLQRLRVSILERGLTPEQSLAELVAFSGLEDRSAEIQTLASEAFLLLTEKFNGSNLPIGRTRVGGEPDLAEGQAWPTHRSGKSLAFLERLGGDERRAAERDHRSGKPLAFLAQVNLSELPTKGIGGLPSRGILSFFSVWGWQNEGDSDLQTPKGRPTPEWTQIVFDKDADNLRRIPVPEGVNSFPAAPARFVPITCFPTEREEPAVAALGWDEETWGRFSATVDAYNAILRQQLGMDERTLFLGYADYEQSFVDEVATRDLRLLFQLASDPNAEMCWGDGGFLYFWATAQEIAQADFTNVYVDSQCG